MPHETISGPSGGAGRPDGKSVEPQATAVIAVPGLGNTRNASGVESRRPLVLVSGATKTTRPDWAGHLIVPRQWHKGAAKAQLLPGRWAMDNGGFGGLFDVGGFVQMLREFADVPGCLFVTAPDVIYSTGVGDHAATVKEWPFWSHLIRGIGRTPAFVLQDGCVEWSDVPPDAEVIFVGGSTAYKESSTVRSLCGIAMARGKWVHWGRVNGRRRYEMALIAGCDSLDGTGFSMFPDTNLPKVDEWQASVNENPTLFSGDRCGR